MYKQTIILLISIFLTSCGVKTQLNENGRITSGKIKHNQKVGKWITNKNGKTFSVGKYKNGKEEGNWKYYYPNGKLHQKGKFINGAGSGIWHYYYSDGNFMGEGEQRSDKQTGLWKWFHKNGQPYTVRLYENGKVLEIKSCFDNDGKNLDCGKLDNGNGYIIMHDLEDYKNPPNKLEVESGDIKWNEEKR